MLNLYEWMTYAGRVHVTLNNLVRLYGTPPQCIGGYHSALLSSPTGEAKA